jgi:hypothetical protein
MRDCLQFSVVSKEAAAAGDATRRVPSDIVQSLFDGALEHLKRLVVFTKVFDQVDVLRTEVKPLEALRHARA